jgi:hypothetical protein
MDIDKAIEKLGLSEWASSSEAKSDKDIEKDMFLCEHELYYTKKEERADADLNQAKDKVKELAAPYKKRKTEQTVKLEYLCQILETRGKSKSST